MGRFLRTVAGNDHHRKGRLIAACLVGLLMISGWGNMARAAVEINLRPAAARRA